MTLTVDTLTLNVPHDLDADKPLLDADKPLRLAVALFDARLPSNGHAAQMACHKQKT